MEYERLDFVEAVEVLAQQHGLEMPQDENNYIRNDHQDLYALLEQANSYFQKNLRKHQHAITYLKNREVSGEIAAKYNLGYAADGFENLLQEFNNSATQEQLINIGLIKKSDIGAVV